MSRRTELRIMGLHRDAQLNGEDFLNLHAVYDSGERTVSALDCRPLLEIRDSLSGQLHANLDTGER